MEKSSQSSFLKNLALAFGDGLLFGVAMKFAQGPSKSREESMTDLGPLAERLRKVEDHTQTIDKDALIKFGEGLDGRVLEKVIVALEARLTEHVGQVDRRMAEIDAQVALDLKAVDTHTSAQTNAVEKALQQIEAQVRDHVAALEQANHAQISGLDQRLSALQEALPAKLREIVEAVRQSLEARVALELKDLEDRVSSQSVTADRLQEVHTALHGEVEALAGRLATEMHGLAEHQQNLTAPLQQALQQLETKLTTLREELPPKIRQIVEAVEASMNARISAGDEHASGQMAALEQALAALRAEMPTLGGFHQAIDDHLRSHAEQVGALDQKLTVLQEELPPKIKAIVDAVRESLDARMAIELEGIEERHQAQAQQAEARFGEVQEQIRRQLAAEFKAPELEQHLAKVQADVAALDGRLETGGRQIGDRVAALEQQTSQAATGVSAELASVRASHQAEMEQLEARLRAERAAENIPARIDEAVTGLRQTLEAKLASEIHDLEARTQDRSPELDKALQYASLLEARVQSLEQKLERSVDESVDRAVERVWQALEAKLQQRQAQAPPAFVPPAESITGLRQKSTSAEQSVMDLIAGIGQLFEKPAPRPVRETVLPEPPAPVATPPVAAAAPAPTEPAHVEPPSTPVAHVEPTPVAEAPAAAAPAEPELEPVAAAYSAPAESEPEPQIEPVHEAPVIEFHAPAPRTPEVATGPPAPPTVAAMGEEEIAEPTPDEKPPVILFKPKDSGRKWRIPFVSTFLLMAAAVAWLQFM